MANIEVILNTFTQSIPPDGTFYVGLGPDDAWRNGGAISATAIPREGDGNTLALEVIQLSMRSEAVTFSPPNIFVDIVVRNNTHVGQPEASTIERFDIYVACVSS